jgi:membrane protein YdbS with pleckstrin-like domain
MKCPSCGAEVAENVVICHSCGARLEHEFGSAPEPAGTGRAERGGGEAPRAKEAEEASPAAAKAAPAGMRDVGESEYPPPWRYSIKDMNIIWINMILLTLAFVAVGIWLSMMRPWPSWLNWLTPPVFWGVMLGIPGVFWLYQLCKLIYRTTIRYDLDESRLIHKEGIFVFKTSVIELIRIADMGATQSLVERFVCGGIGKVHVHSEDPTDPHLVLRGLENHESIFRQIDKKRAEARKKKAFVQA